MHLAIGGALGVAISLVDVPLVALVEDAALVEHATEVAVIVATGLKIDRALGWRDWRSVALLLGIVMPLTIAAVALWGALLMGLSLGAALVLGAALAPTDPVLAGDLGVGAPGQGGEEEPRFAVTAEAGLNDGLAFPFVLLGLLLDGGEGAGGLLEWGLAAVVYATVVGLALGAVIGRLLASGATRPRERGVLDTRLDGWAAIAAVLLTTASSSSPAPTASSPRSPAASRSAGASASTSTTRASTPGPRCQRRPWSWPSSWPSARR